MVICINKNHINEALWAVTGSSSHVSRVYGSRVYTGCISVKVLKSSIHIEVEPLQFTSARY